MATLYINAATLITICIFIISPVLILLIAATRLLKTKPKSKNGSPLNLPPGSLGWPVLGETLEFLGTNYKGLPGKFVTDRVQNYKSRVFKTSFFGERMVVLCGPAGNKFLFGNENKKVAIWWPASIRNLLGTCLSTTGGAEGLHMRRRLAHFLSPDAFSKLYLRDVDLESRQHLDIHWQGKDELKVFPTIKLYLFEVACRLFMSVDDSSLTKKLFSHFNVFLSGILSIPLDFPGTKYYRGKRAADAIRKELRIILEQRKKALERKTASPPQDLLSHLLQTPDDNGEFMSEKVIVNNILLLIWAGHDTSACTIALLMKALAEHPEVYEMVLREQNEIASSKKPGECLQWEDIQRMRYSWNVVCETLRMWPPVVGAYREALENISYEGYDIPKGWKFYWNTQSIHKDPSLFPDETQFDPSRFDGSGPVPYSFVPFGGGPRMCVGKEFARLEILVFLHNLVRRFKWELVVPEEKLCGDPFLTPEKGLPIRLHPRT
ncbi:cytochrome P450- family 716- subfamily A-polypeptide 1 [Striga hermonthica]|uniref:Cytochrome P450- family 716- subfamily A-polypeptide 1 n=1 Tax=Striga hermonthica TaxID=68872 RepID=A0A9N7NMQ1_STRHE|nr:cytochrome P450- family 716- subfamily A-polypeptide 1 [Striga hermonthica]